MRTFLLPLTLLVLSSGCISYFEDDDASSVPRVDGHWTGTVELHGVNFSFAGDTDPGTLPGQCIFEVIGPRLEREYGVAVSLHQSGRSIEGELAVAGASCRLDGSLEPPAFLAFAPPGWWMSVRGPCTGGCRSFTCEGMEVSVCPVSVELRESGLAPDSHPSAMDPLLELGFSTSDGRRFGLDGVAELSR